MSSNNNTLMLENESSDSEEAVPENSRLDEQDNLPPSPPDDEPDKNNDSKKDYSYDDLDDDAQKQYYRSCQKFHVAHDNKISILFAMTIGVTGYESILEDDVFFPKRPSDNTRLQTIFPAKKELIKEVDRRFHFLSKTFKVRKPRPTNWSQKQFIEWLETQILPPNEADKSYLDAQIAATKELLEREGMDCVVKAQAGAFAKDGMRASDRCSWQKGTGTSSRGLAPSATAVKATGDETSADAFNAMKSLHQRSLDLQCQIMKQRDIQHAESRSQSEMQHAELKALAEKRDLILEVASRRTEVATLRDVHVKLQQMVAQSRHHCLQTRLQYGLTASPLLIQDTIAQYLSDIDDKNQQLIELMTAIKEKEEAVCRLEAQKEKISEQINKRPASSRCRGLEDEEDESNRPLRRRTRLRNK